LGYSDKITEHKWNSAGELLIGGKHKINSNITPIFLKLERAEIDKMKNGFK
jgi:hypothetical protein